MQFLKFILGVFSTWRHVWRQEAQLFTRFSRIILNSDSLRYGVFLVCLQFGLISDNNKNKNESFHLTGFIHYCYFIIHVSFPWHFLLPKNLKKHDFRVESLILFNCLERNERTISEEEKKCLLKSASTVVWWGANMCVSVHDDVVRRERAEFCSLFYVNSIFTEVVVSSETFLSWHLVLFA